MLNDVTVFVYEPFAEWTEQVTKWGATIVSTPEGASVIVCDAKPKERLANKPKILYPVVLARMLSHGTDFTDMDLSKTTLKQGYLCGLNLSGADFTNVNLSNATFEGSNLAGANFTKAGLNRVNFQRCNLIGIVVENTGFNQCEFADALMRGIYYENIPRDQVTIVGSNVEWSDKDVSGISLRGCTLSESKLLRVNLTGTDCSDVNFTNTTFAEVNCTDVNFSGTNLRGADLSGATLVGNTFTKAHYNASTKWPVDFDLSSIGAIGPSTVHSNTGRVLDIKQKLMKCTDEFSIGELHALQSALQDAMERSEERIIMDSLQIAVHCLPDLSEITFEFESTYNDEGGYNLNFRGTNQSGPFFRWWGFYQAEIRQSSVIMALSDGWGSIKPPAPDPDFQHPMLNLFDGYTPKNLDHWTKMWTLLTSLKLEQRKQGQSLLEMLVVSDSDLRNHLVSIGSKTLHSEYVSRLYDAKLGFWHLFYLDVDTTAEVDGVYVEDLIYSGVYEVYPEERWHQPRTAEVMDSNILFRGVDSLFLPVIHLALTESGADTTQFLQEAEVLLGKPLVD